MENVEAWHKFFPINRVETYPLGGAEPLETVKILYIIFYGFIEFYNWNVFERHNTLKALLS